MRLEALLLSKRAEGVGLLRAIDFTEHRLLHLHQFRGKEMLVTLGFGDGRLDRGRWMVVGNVARCR